MSTLKVLKLKSCDALVAFNLALEDLFFIKLLDSLVLRPQFVEKAVRMPVCEVVKL